MRGEGVKILKKMATWFLDAPKGQKSRQESLLIYTDTHRCRSLTTLLVKYYNIGPTLQHCESTAEVYTSKINYYTKYLKLRVGLSKRTFQPSKNIRLELVFNYFFSTPLGSILDWKIDTQHKNSGRTILRLFALSVFLDRSNLYQESAYGAILCAQNKPGSGHHQLVLYGF